MSSGTTVEFFFDCSSQWTKLAFHNIRAVSPDLAEVFALWTAAPDPDDSRPRSAPAP